MTATKFTLELFATALHKDCIRSLLQRALEELDGEVSLLNLKFDDGDTVHYEIKTQEVSF